MEDTSTIKGQLEIDYNRGIVWFNSDQGIYRLRICNIPSKMLCNTKEGLIDLTLGVSEGKIDLKTFMKGRG